MKNVLTDLRGNFSWRKALTATCGVIFLVACIGYLAFGWKELPVQYTSVLAGVFTFYFTRRFYDNVGSKTKQDSSGD